MSKRLTPPSGPQLDLRPFALIGARQQPDRLLNERAHIVALFPELRVRQAYARLADAPPPLSGTHTCAACLEKFTPDSQHPTQKTCGRPECVKAYKRDYMRAYFARRAAKAKRAARTGAAS